MVTSPREGGANNPHGNPNNPGNRVPSWRKHADDDLWYALSDWQIFRGWQGTRQRGVRGAYALVVAEDDPVTPFHVYASDDVDQTGPVLYKNSNAEHAARWVEAMYAGLRL